MMDRKKIELVIAYFAVLFAAVILRLLQIAIHRQPELFHAPKVPSKRGMIYDRNNNILATSIPAVSAYIKPDEFVIELDESLEKIKQLFPTVDIGQIREGMKYKKFIWLKRYMSPKDKRILMDAGMPGVYLLDVDRRVYPDKGLFSHVLGGVDIDNEGIAGVEKYFNDDLKKPGAGLRLSLDIRVQHIVEEELEAGINRFSANGGVGIVMDGSNGQILAMVSLPNFDPNNITKSSKTFNQATFGLFEPGSIAKVLTVALGLESGAVRLDTMFDISKPIRIGRFTIHDFKRREGVFSVKDIFKFSSNIGSAKIADKIGKERQQAFLKKLGLFDKIQMEIFECQRPLMPSVWRDSTLLTIGYGHGMAISPLHMLCAINGVLNDGEMVRPTLLIRNYIESKRIVSKQTSQLVSGVMREIVTDTSGRMANIGGYAVIGKTGTSEKAIRGGYNKKENICFFVAKFAQYAILVMLDNPSALKSTYGFRSANWNAAPVAGNIIRRVGPVLGVVPDRSRTPINI